MLSDFLWHNGRLEFLSDRFVFLIFTLTKEKETLEWARVNGPENEGHACCLEAQFLQDDVRVKDVSL